jgi:hypothetical protein
MAFRDPGGDPLAGPFRGFDFLNHLIFNHIQTTLGRESSIMAAPTRAVV